MKPSAELSSSHKLNSVEYTELLDFYSKVVLYRKFSTYFPLSLLADDRTFLIKKNAQMADNYRSHLVDRIVN